MAIEQRPRKTARLVIVDDHDLARAGLRAMLAGERGLEVVADAASGAEGVALCRRLQPDLVLMDVRMPGMDGLAAARAIKQDCPRTSVIMVTLHENPSYLLDAIKVGAAGYVLKDASHQELLASVRRVLAGESLLSPTLLAHLVQHLAGLVRESQPGPVERITPREREVLRLIARGQTNREIARSLTISPGTAKVHVERILSKLGVSDRTQAVVRGLEQGLITSFLE